MPSITSCPHCRRDIVVGSKLDPQQKLRCPHCSADFLVLETFACTTELPPLAMPILPAEVSVEASDALLEPAVAAIETSEAGRSLETDRLGTDSDQSSPVDQLPPAEWSPPMEPPPAEPINSTWGETAEDAEAVSSEPAAAVTDEPQSSLAPASNPAETASEAIAESQTADPQTADPQTLEPQTIETLSNAAAVPPSSATPILGIDFFKPATPAPQDLPVAPVETVAAEPESLSEEGAVAANLETLAAAPVEPTTADPLAPAMEMPSEVNEPARAGADAGSEPSYASDVEFAALVAMESGTNGKKSIGEPRCPLCGTLLAEHAVSSAPPAGESPRLPSNGKTAGRSLPDLFDRFRAWQEWESARHGDPAVSDLDETPYRLAEPGVATEEALSEEATEAAAGEWAAPPTFTSKPRRRQKQVNPLFHMIGIVGGGIFGLAIGYAIIYQFRGDVLGIMKNLPSMEEVKEWFHFGSEPSDSSSRLRESPHGSKPTGAAGIAPVNLMAGRQPANISTSTSSENNLPRVGPKSPLRFEAAALATALAEADEALGCDRCNGSGLVPRIVVTGFKQVNGRKVEQTDDKQVRCEHCQGRTSGKFTAETFQKLCQLAEVATFANVDHSLPDYDQIRQQALHVLDKAASDRDRMQTIGRLAGLRLAGHPADPDRQPTTGIILAGTVQELSQQGRLFRMKLVLFGLPKVVTVMSWRPPDPPLRPQDRVLVLGSIIDRPDEELVGYEGAASQIVWGGLPKKIVDGPRELLSREPTVRR